MNANTNCSGFGPHAAGEVRLLPVGGGGNDALCRRCFDQAIRYRRHRNAELDAARTGTQFDLPLWTECRVLEN